MAELGSATLDLRAVDSGFSSAIAAAGKQIGGLGTAVAAIGVGVAAAGIASIAAAANWESAFAGVRKTVEATESQFDALAEGIRDMAKEKPISAESLAAIAEMGGALGIAQEDILTFTDVVADMAQTTNLSAEQAAEGMARFANVMKTPISELDRMGSTIVHLGNTLAATESEILEFGQRLSGIGQLMGISEADVLSLGAAMASLGLEAESGSTAVQRTFIEMSKAMADGGTKAQEFARVAGMSVQEFATTLETDAMGALVAFIEGLSQMSQTEALQTLEELGLSDVRVTRALLTMAGGVDTVNKALENGREAWGENTALQDEAAKRYETTASQFQILKNRIYDVAITIGSFLLPVFNDLLELLGPAITQLGELAEWMAEVADTGRIWNKEAEDLPRSWDPFLQKLGEIIQTVRNDLVPAIRDDFLPVLEKVGEMFLTGLEGIQQFVDWIRQLGNEIGLSNEQMLLIAVALGALLLLFLLLPTALIIVVAAIVALGAAIMYLPGLIQQAGDLLNQFWTMLPGPIQAALQIISDFFIAWWASLMTVVQGAMTAIQGIINIVLGLIHGDWSRVWQGIQQLVSGILTILQGLIQGALAMIEAVIRTQLLLMKTAFEVAWAAIKAVVSAAISAVQSAVSAGIGQITSLIGQLPGRAQSALSGLAGILAGVAQSAFSHMYSTASGLITDLLSLIGRIPGQVESALSGLFDVAFAAGKSLIQGLIDGINSLIGTLEDAIGTVGDLMSKVPGFGSGKVPLEVAGRHRAYEFMGGLIGGLNEKLGELGMTTAAVGATVSHPTMNVSNTWNAQGYGIQEIYSAVRTVQRRQATQWGLTP